MHQYTSKSLLMTQQDKPIMPIHIDSEFAALIPAQSEDESAALEQSILSEGCRDALVIWKGHDILLDGHNRYAICQRHNLPFRTLEREFATREDVIIWICQNQLARRNITTYTRSKLALRMKDVFETQAKERQIRKPESVRQNSDEQIRTDEAVAEIADVSRDTVRKVERVEAEAPPQVKEAAGTGEISVNRAYNITVALKNTPPEYVETFLQLSGDEPEKIETLNRLYKSQNKPGSNGTFAEIMTTGGFSHGDEMKDWCNFAGAKMAEITRGLTSIAHYHTILNNDKHPPIMTSSKDIEYYTPIEYLDAARRVMGIIDLDPSSCEEANRQVQAANYYTIDIDGLSQEWFGNVWLNPPYGALAADFGTRLIQEYQSGNVKQAITLFNAHITDTHWFAPFWDHLVCFTNHRINFLNTDDKSGSTHGSCFVYLGNNASAFIREFKPFGVIVKRVDNDNS